MKISVVTVCYNCVDDIQCTVDSVSAQNYTDVEHIIIDGNSTDGTIEVLRGQSWRFSHLVSEPDDGIYDAMNKGIALSTGKWINFMNAGDTFESEDTLSGISFVKYQNSAVVYGKCRRDGIVRSANSLEAVKYGFTIGNHQSMFFNRDILKENIYYDKNLFLSGDSELITRIVHEGLPIDYVDMTISRYKGDGISSKFSLLARMQKYKRMFEYFGLMGVLRSLGITLRLLDKSRFKRALSE